MGNPLDAPTASTGRAGVRYIRFKELPPNGFSRDHSRCGPEFNDPYRHLHCWPLPGVSVWRATTIDGVPHVLLPLNERALHDLSWSIHSGQPWQWVTGELVGTGPVGEPLLTNASVAKEPQP